MDSYAELPTMLPRISALSVMEAIRLCEFNFKRNINMKNEIEKITDCIHNVIGASEEQYCLNDNRVSLYCRGVCKRHYEKEQKLNEEVVSETQ